MIDAFVKGVVGLAIVIVLALAAEVVRRMLK
jgi:hypothetical protein